MNLPRGPMPKIKGTGVVKPNAMGRLVFRVVVRFGVPPGSPLGKMKRQWLLDHLMKAVHNEVFERAALRKQFIQEVLEEFGIQDQYEGEWLNDQLQTVWQYYKDRETASAHGQDPDAVKVPYG